MFSTAEHIGVLVANTVTLDIGIRQLVVEELGGFQVRFVHLGFFRSKEAYDKEAQEQDGNIQDGRKHILRLPEVNLFCKLHIRLFDVVYNC